MFLGWPGEAPVFFDIQYLRGPLHLKTIKTTEFQFLHQSSEITEKRVGALAEVMVRQLVL